MKIKNKAKQDIRVSQMNDGQIGVITSWPSDVCHEGVIVQRYGKALVKLGKDSENSWPELFGNSPVDNEAYRVEILPEGTELVV